MSSVIKFINKITTDVYPASLSVRSLACVLSLFVISPLLCLVSSAKSPLVCVSSLSRITTDVCLVIIRSLMLCVLCHQ